MKPLSYPTPRRVDQTDDYHGTPVADPFRWLEDPDSAETQAWIEAQNRLTFDYLNTIPHRDAIRRRMTALWDFAKAWAPAQKGGQYFQLRNSGLQNQNVLHVTASLADPGRVLLDPNTLSTDGTVALTGWAVSRDGKYLAYATSASGSDWQTWKVRAVDTGTDLADVVEWSKFSGAVWAADGSGFYYARYDAPAPGADFTGVNYFQKLYFHTLGQPQAADRLIYERPDQKEWGFGPWLSDDGRYLIIVVWQGTDARNRLFYQDLHTGGPVVELISELEAEYQFIDNDGSVFYLRTSLDAPRRRVIAIDTTTPDRARWRTLIPEADDMLETVTMANNEFIALYLRDAHHQLKRFALDGRWLGDVALPTLGALVALPNEALLDGQRTESELFYTFNSFVVPPTVYGFNFKTETAEPVNIPELDVDLAQYTTQQTFVVSKDGTRVPLFIVHRRDIQYDGQNPTLLYGYGGFNVPLTPAFTIARLMWLELGGVFAMANLRGGGEYGEAWHEAGMIHNKQNVFDDFIACAEALITQNITSTPKLAIWGGSNGGLLVGACMTQRPDLFGACLPAVGVMDMLRFHKFTIGWAWVSDYGSAADPEQFKTLYAYSPLHNLKPGTPYPPTLITTADHDDRVVPAHSFKFAAALQAAQGGPAPALIRIQTKAGHGAGKPTPILIEELSDMWAFLVQALGMGVALN